MLQASCIIIKILIGKFYRYLTGTIIVFKNGSNDNQIISGCTQDLSAPGLVVSSAASSHMLAT